MIRRGLCKKAAAVWPAIAAVVLLGFAASSAASAAPRTGAGTAAPSAAALTPADTRQVCATPATPGWARCLSLIRTDVQPSALATPAIVPAGYGPSSLQLAYNLPSTTAGGGRTVAIVDAYEDPDAASDLAAYRSQYGLPACTAASGCFTKVNELGQASPLPAASGSTGWATEESLDIDMVSAICPNCRILLVEASTPAISDLGTAVNSAVSLGARFISNSYGASESSAETGYDSSYYNHPGVAITASAGDSGYGVEFPAASPHVVAVGGTSLTATAGGRGWAETAWNGTGSGCSAYEPKPSWQTDSGCARRTNNDVSAVADPNTGVAVYDTYDQGGWVVLGGTSVASPIIAATYALGGYPASGSYPASSAYAHSGPLFDVTSGANGSCSPAYLCTAGLHYDGPTGLGTPNGPAAFISGGGPGDEVAFQASTGNLWVTGPAGSSNTGLGMAAGTSPSITGLTGGGYEVAFQASTGNLWVTGPAGSSNTGLGMAAGTSPSIAALPGGGYEVAFQASTGHLWIEGSAGTSDTGLTMKPGTSPAITDLPPENNTFYPNGGLEAVFQGSDGHPWDYSPSSGGGLMSSSASLAAGTSMAIVPTPAGGGSWQALWQGANNHLWTTGAGPTDTGLAMKPGTSPAITDLPAEANTFYPNGGIEAVFQGSDGHPWDYSPGSGGGPMSSSVSLAPGTSMAIIPTPAGGGSWQAYWQGANNHLWSTGAGPTDTGLTMMPGTSPAITALS